MSGPTQPVCSDQYELQLPAPMGWLSKIHWIKETSIEKNTHYMISFVYGPKIGKTKLYSSVWG